jgi:tetratricopeptide (TPR) repeat protein
VNLEEAESLARRALAQSPEDAYIMDTVGWILFKQGQLGQAIQYLEAAYRLKPDEAVIAEHLGDCYLRFQLAEKAQKMYRRAAELEQDTDRQATILSKLEALQAPSGAQGSRVPAAADSNR